MEVLRIEKSKGWPEILRLMPETPKEKPLFIDLESEGAVRQAISRPIKRNNPEMKFGTEIGPHPDLGYDVLKVWKEILPANKN